MKEIKAICSEFNIPILEDAAEFLVALIKMVTLLVPMEKLVFSRSMGIKL